MQDEMVAWAKHYLADCRESEQVSMILPSCRSSPVLGMTAERSIWPRLWFRRSDTLLAAELPRLRSMSQVLAQAQ